MTPFFFILPLSLSFSLHSSELVTVATRLFQLYFSSIPQVLESDPSNANPTIIPLVKPLQTYFGFSEKKSYNQKTISSESQQSFKYLQTQNDSLI
ncbi:hypothetical protein BY996DRAFT_3184040 [Phakopsora pachyrhizi]|nr:hypothetical protein BY996DRAFT_3184040 [Phakopsora pachyrhizi]